MSQISGDKRNVVPALLSLQDEARDEDEEETEGGEISQWPSDKSHSADWLPVGSDQVERMEKETEDTSCMSISLY